MSKTVGLKQFLCAGACASGAFASAASIAQEASSDAAAASSQVSGLEEIVVTAQRRGQNLQDVPIAVTALSADQLENAGIARTDDLANVTPALQMTLQQGNLLPRLRGVGTTVVGPGIENSVAVYVDGVYVVGAAASAFSLNNVERIEVLKGPQGTLFGRNSTGGLIQIITKDPAQGFGGNVEAGYGDYQTPTFDGSIEGGSDTFRVGTAVHYSNRKEGFGRNFFDGTETDLVDDDVAARTTFLFLPTDRTKLRVSLDYSYLSTGAPVARNLETQLPAFPTVPTPPAGLTSWPSGHYDLYQNTPTDRTTRQGGAAATLTQELGSLYLTSITAYRRNRFDANFDIDRTPANLAFVDNTSRDRQFSQELQLASHKDSAAAASWVFGLFYFDARSEADPATTQTPPVPLRVNTVLGNETVESYAAYGQVTYPLLSKLNLTLGARYTREEKSADSTQTVTNAATGALLSAPVTLNDTADFGHATWRAAIDYTIAPDLMLYASFSTGFTSGGFNITTPDIPTPYAQENIKAYETGFKSQLFDHTLRLNVSAFYYDYSNIQVAFLGGGTFGGTIGVTNGPAAEIYGLDADFEALLGAGFRLTGGLNALHGRFGDFPGAIINTPLPSGANSRTLGNAKGNELPYTAPFTGNLGLSYVMNAFGGVIDASTNVYCNAGFYPEVDNLRKQDSFTTLSASLKWTSPGNFSIRLWGDNLTDEAVVNTIASAPAASSVSYKAPRMYGITLAQSF